jgi:hypothetical protein
MERTTFCNLAEPWWLLVPEGVDPRIEKAREDLATNLGWDRLWFTLQPDVDRLFDLLTSSYPFVLDELDRLTDLEQWVRWLDDLVTSTKPKATPPPGGDGAAAPPIGVVVDQALSQLSLVAKELDMSPEELHGLADDPQFKEILANVLASRLGSSGS